jgi:hypothetical protein
MFWKGSEAVVRPPRSECPQRSRLLPSLVFRMDCSRAHSWRFSRHGYMVIGGEIASSRTIGGAWPTRWNLNIYVIIIDCRSNSEMGAK